ncbi:MAG TPA: Bax inhibitor-1 family protein [Baekduia sp.]|nr:Bax inhibitor-1 family protein [Baekduia sp.]
MSDLFDSSYAGATRAPARASTATLFGQVMFLVGLAIGFLALGSLIGRDLELGTARILSFAGIGMLFAQSFVEPLRRGSIGIAWLFGLALILGLSLGPVLDYYVKSEPEVVTQAAGGTALITLGMGAYGMATSKDLAKWIRPLSFAMLGLFAISLLLLLFGAGGNPLLSLAVLAVSSALLIVDFNYLRRHATEDDVIWLATGIFVSIVNIFLSLLNLLRN